MTKTIAITGVLLAALATSTPAFAQVGGGIKAGVNLATISGYSDVSDRRVGLVAGGFMTFGFTPILAFNPEVLFSQQGSGSGIENTKVDYIQVPLLLRIGNSGKDNVSVYAVAGPTFGLLARKQDADDVLKNTDIGLTGGVGVTASRLLLEVRYTGGLTDFNRGGIVYKNRVLSILGGVIF
jgi:hypothetical protein